MTSWTRRVAAIGVSVLGLAVALSAVLTLGGAEGSTALARFDVPADANRPAALGRAPAATARYIVELVDPPLAQYRGGTGKLAPTALVEGQGRHLDVTTPAARAYLAYLDREQALAQARIHAVAPAARFDWQYRYVFNGFAATLTPQQADRVSHLVGVRHVQAEERLEPELDASLPLVGAPDAFDQVGGISEAGINTRIALIDAGVDSNHPFLDDAGMPPAPAGYPTATMHLRDGSVHAYPQPETYTNGKVVAARVFVSPEYIGATDVFTALRQFTPLGQGHGLHVAGIAAGRDGHYEISTNGQTVSFHLSGVAPMAFLLNYKSNYAATPEYIAMLDQMVLDEVDVINMSQGHVGWLIDRPDTHPLGRAFEGAFDAGILPVMSAGNAGANGYTSLSGAFKYSEKVLAVGNSTSSGTFDVQVTFSGQGVPLTEIAAAPRGTFTPTAALSGALYLAPDGGCAPAPGAAGKIAVVDRMGEGTCGYAPRADFMAQSGALAVIFYYNDRSYGGASTAEVALPSVAIGARGGDLLMAWLRSDPPDAAATIDNVIQRGRSDVPDVVDGSSSSGPGLDWTLKPDIAAPGDGIISSYYLSVGGELQPGFAALSGTSMSSPHVAGAAALLRSAHPGWSPGQVQSALVNTSWNDLVAGSGLDLGPAPSYLGGPGRLDLRHAVYPRAVFDPVKASFGKLELGETAHLEITLQSVSDQTETWSLSVQPVTGTAPAVWPITVTVAAGESATIDLDLDTDGAAQDESWGDVTVDRLQEEDPGEPPLRVPYYAYVEDPAGRKDVLVVDWDYGSTPDYTGYYTAALESLGLTYDVWTIRQATPEVPSKGHVPFKVLQKYDLVVLNQNESVWAFQEALPGAYQYLNVLLHGGNMLIAGQGQMNWWRFLSKSQYPDNDAYHEYCGAWWPFCFVGPSQNAGCEMCLARYFAGFTYGVTATLTGKLLGAHELPDRTARQVVLAPHPEADGPFGYSLDLSTGALAKDGAAGNQYTFASGELLGPYEPSGEEAADGRDLDNTETVFDRIRPYARPMWAYTGPFTQEDGTTDVVTKVVGTYVGGRLLPNADIAWNAMFWGFGLEGVGQGSMTTVGRDRLFGDSFNYLALNLDPRAVVPRWNRQAGLELELPDVASVPMVGRVAVRWGDGGTTQEVTVDPPLRADQLQLWHGYAAEGNYDVALDLYPSAHAAPLYGIAGTIRYRAPLAGAYLPVAVRRAPLGCAAPPCP